MPDRDGCEPPNFGFVSTFTDVGLVIRKGHAAFRANMGSTLRWLCELNRGRSGDQHVIPVRGLASGVLPRGWTVCIPVSRAPRCDHSPDTGR